MTAMCAPMMRSEDPPFQPNRARAADDGPRRPRRSRRVATAEMESTPGLAGTRHEPAIAASVEQNTNAWRCAVGRLGYGAARAASALTTSGTWAGRYAVPTQECERKITTIRMIGTMIGTPGAR